MIKLEDDKITIEGSNGQLLYEFAHIFNAFLNSHPEIVAATCVHFGDQITNSGFDPAITHGAVKFLSDIGGEFDD